MRQSSAGTDNPGYKIHGVIDFGDMHTAHYLFELAILLCYMMLECVKIELDPLEGSGYTLAGYMTKRNVSDLELKLLRVRVKSNSPNVNAITNLKGACKCKARL